MKMIPKLIRDSLGASMIEFALTAMTFFLFIFGIYEVGMMMATQNGLMAGTFYAARRGTCGRTLSAYNATPSTTNITFAQVQTEFKTKYDLYGLGSFTLVSSPSSSANPQVARYSNITNAINNTSPTNASLGSTSNAASPTNNVTKYSATRNYTFITNLIASSGSTKALSFSKVYVNEPY